MTTVEYDMGDEDMPSVAVVRAVAAETGVPVADLDCTLERVIDTKALNRLFTTRPNGTPRTVSDGYVQFAFCGCDVTVYNDGHLTATRTDQ